MAVRICMESGAQSTSTNWRLLVSRGEARSGLGAVESGVVAVESGVVYSWHLVCNAGSHVKDIKSEDVADGMLTAAEAAVVIGVVAVVAVGVVALAVAVGKGHGNLHNVQLPGGLGSDVHASHSPLDFPEPPLAATGALTHVVHGLAPPHGVPTPNTPTSSSIYGSVSVDISIPIPIPDNPPLENDNMPGTPRNDIYSANIPHLGDPVACNSPVEPLPAEVQPPTQNLQWPEVKNNAPYITASSMNMPTGPATRKVQMPAEKAEEQGCYMPPILVILGK